MYFHKQTKNTWARDDPALILLVVGAGLVAAIAWAAAWARTASPAAVLGLAARIIVRDFLLVGALIATALRTLANRALTQPGHTHATDQSVEWLFAFDVHVNAFVPFFIDLYAAQLVLAPVITRPNWIALAFGNTLYAAAFVHYIVVTWLGYGALPFLVRTDILLAPAGLVLALYAVSLFGWNVSSAVLDAYFAFAR